MRAFAVPFSQFGTDRDRNNCRRESRFHIETRIRCFARPVTVNEQSGINGERLDCRTQPLPWRSCGYAPRFLTKYSICKVMVIIVVNHSETIEVVGML